MNTLKPHTTLGTFANSVGKGIDYTTRHQLRPEYPIFKKHSEQFADLIEALILHHNEVYEQDDPLVFRPTGLNAGPNPARVLLSRHTEDKREFYSAIMRGEAGEAGPAFMTSVARGAGGTAIAGLRLGLTFPRSDGVVTYDDSNIGVDCWKGPLHPPHLNTTSDVDLGSLSPKSHGIFALGLQVVSLLNETIPTFDDWLPEE